MGWSKDGLRCPKKLVLPSCTTEEIPFLKKDCKMERQSIQNLDLDRQDISKLEPFRKLSL